MTPHVSSDNKKGLRRNPAVATAGDEGLTPEPATDWANKMKTTPPRRQTRRPARTAGSVAAEFAAENNLDEVATECAIGWSIGLFSTRRLSEREGEMLKRRLTVAFIVEVEAMNEADRLHGDTPAPSWYISPQPHPGFESALGDTALRTYERHYDTPVGTVMLFRADEALGKDLTIGESVVVISIPEEHLGPQAAIELGRQIVKAGMALAAEDRAAA